MPYIDRSTRRILLTEGIPPVNAGDLNYMITKYCDAYLRTKGRRYEHINTVIGVLECAKQEFYRRIAAPYENEKIAENGDVYSASNLPDVTQSGDRL
jgi:hypothetical protein